MANTRPVGRIRPSTLFYPAWHLVSTWRQCQAPCPWLRSSYIYTVLKLHLALWRQPRGWCGPWWKWVWHPLFNGRGGQVLQIWLTHIHYTLCESIVTYFHFRSSYDSCLYFQWLHVKVLELLDTAVFVVVVNSLVVPWETGQEILCMDQKIKEVCFWMCSSLEKEWRQWFQPGRQVS